jgi:hypothetical protein
MLSVSAAMLVSSTFAWFTMNKTVKATTMEVKAHAEEGLLINEVKAHADTHWDEEATANTTAQVFSLRPASTADLAKWWHANSLKSADEAGMGELTNTVDIDGNGTYYTDISPAKLTNNTVIGAENAESGEKATGGTKAETHVYYSDATFGTPGTYQDGEGFYVNYKYYIKASSTSALNVTANNLGVNVTATKLNAEEATNLDKALRVGVKIGSDTLIFAPTGGDTSYDVTGDTAGTAANKKAVTAQTTKTGINSAALSIPSVNTDGMLVDVYIWFEGEDQNCMSDNLTATLNSYKIDISFTNDDL